MKPIKLNLQAFGPYLNETIDFSSFYEHHIFLIAGKTGAGKTTLFDAMSYALFGKTNGLNREPKEMRSTFAKPSEETKVVFTFSAQNKVYQIERIPEQVLAKKRGDGVREVKAKATITIFDEFGKELNHFTKTTEVNQIVEEVVQLEDEQFRQIIMLPQGDFRRFLNANSNEKEKILRKLFGTEPYRLFSEKLKEQKKLISVAIKDQEKELITTLQHARWVTELPEILELGQARGKKELSYLKEQQENMHNQLQKNEKRIQLLKEEENKRQLELQKVQAEILLFNEKEQLYSQQNIHKSATERITTLKEKLNKLKEAELIQPLLVRQLELKNEMAELATEVHSLENQKKLAEKEQNYWETLYQEKLAESPEQERREMKLIELKQQKIVLDGYSRVRQEAERLAEKINLLDREKVACGNQLQEKQKQEMAIVQKLDQLKEVEQQLNHLDKEQTRVQTIDQKLVEFSQIEEKIQQLKNQEITVRDSLLLAEEKVAETEKNYLKAKSDWAKIQIRRLALDLEDGAPCPVCGSVEHPYLHSQVEDMDEFETMSQAENQLDFWENELTTVKETVASFKTRIEGLHEQLADSESQLEKRMENDPLATRLEKSSLDQLKKEVKVQLEKIETQIMELKQQHSKETELLEEQNKLKSFIEKKSAELNIIEQDYQNVWQEQLEKKGELTQIKQQLPLELLDETIFKGRLSQLELEVAAFKQELSERELKKVAAQDQLKEIISNQAHLKKQSAKAEKLELELTEKLNDAISQSSFENQKSIEATLTELEEVVDWEKEVQQYEKEEYRITQRIAELENQLLSVEKPNVEIAESRLKEVAIERETMQEEQTRNQQIHMQNKKVLKEATEIIRSIQEQWDLLDEVTNLSAVANGDGDQSKMGFERYVLTYFLEEVLTIANGRLQQLSNNRYLFDLNREEGSRKTDTGLEINIYDDNAGGLRNVRTLSGGESFIAALALSLSLSEVVQQHAGGIQIETMFIDEGFGSLDEDALEEAMDALLQIEGSGRLVGIISHVKELKERIPDKLLVESNGTGKSKIKISHG